MTIFTLLFSACSGNTNSVIDDVPAVQASSGLDTELANSQTTAVPISVDYESDDLDTGAANADMTIIKLNGSSITFEGSGAVVNGNVITITAGGTYSIGGTLYDGQIVVDSEDEETVVLVFNGVDITYATSAPVFVLNAEKTVITLADGTSNQVTDGSAYVFEDAETDEPNAAIFSKDDLTINGSGSLTVSANYNNGIASKDDLKITGGTITVTAVNDGIKGKDSIAIKDGNITVVAGSDGLQAYNDTDAKNGYISIEGGTLNITAQLDGIQAQTSLQVSGGNITVSSGGGSSYTSSGNDWGNWGKPNNTNTAEDTTDSAKGLKADVDITITGGMLNIDSSDDAVHSNNSITIDGGILNLASGDDGMHSDTSLVINNGEVNITQSYEGIESAMLTINDGNIHIVAGDDGLNGSGGADGSSVNGRPGQNNFNFSANASLAINGGSIAINAAGDGIDINGSITMSAGLVIVNGPTNNGNGPLDYLGDFNISGGFILAVGSSGMAQSASNTSTQYSILHNYDTVQAAGTMVHIESQDGTEVLSFTPAKEYQSILISSPELQNGATYIFYSGGSSSGTAGDGLYTAGTIPPARRQPAIPSPAS